MVTVRGKCERVQMLWMRSQSICDKLATRLTAGFMRSEVVQCLNVDEECVGK